MPQSKWREKQNSIGMAVPYVPGVPVERQGLSPKLLAQLTGNIKRYVNLDRGTVMEGWAKVGPRRSVGGYIYPNTAGQHGGYKYVGGRC